MTRKMITGIALLMILFAQASFAGDVVMGDPEGYTKPACNKLWRGFVNTFTGIGEIVRQPIICTKTDGPVGVPVGIINGVVMSFVRTGSGIVEMITFPIPFDEKIGYESLINPDYVWQKADTEYLP